MLRCTTCIHRDLSVGAKNKGTMNEHFFTKKILEEMLSLFISMFLGSPPQFPEACYEKCQGILVYLIQFAVPSAANCLPKHPSVLCIAFELLKSTLYMSWVCSALMEIKPQF